jgi:protoporphyrinogen oxidase
VPFVENDKISGYVNEAMKGKEAAHDGESLFCVWLHEAYARSVMGKNEEEIFAAVKQEALKVCPWFSSVDDLKNHDLQRWPHAMPKFSHGHLKAVQTFLKEGQGKQNVYFCGDYVNAPWTEGALRMGKRLAGEITRAA